MDRLSTFLSLAAGLRTVLAQGYPAPPQLPETSFLDHDTPLQSYQSKTFLKQNIPFIDIPDQSIQDVYYFRWYSLSHHLVYAAPGTGYVIPEFTMPVSYGGPFGTIDAAAGHQIEEARWLRSPWFSEDNIQIWTRGTGNSAQYTHWIHYAAEGTANVTGDQAFLQSQLDGMVRIWHQWDYTFNSSVGLYYFTPDFDAQEYSLPGYVADASEGGADDNNVQYVGPNTYRPSHNGYMYANAQSIVNIANAIGNSSIAQEFQGYASSLEQAIYSNLWSTDQSFFVDNIAGDQPAPGQVSGREEVGFFPFRFGLGLSDQYANSTIDALFDPQGFYTPYGPPTLEVRNQYYTETKPTDYCCYWQGQSWPYSTAHLLKSLAELYRSNFLTADQYYEWLGIYAATQYKNGSPWIAESHFPVDNSWSQDAPDHSEYYQHSTNNDLVITGLLGVIPRADDTFELDPIVPSNWTYFALENLPYHGGLITVLYDQDGSRYNQGSGLTIFFNGKNIYNGEGVTAQVQLPSTPTSTTAPTPMPVNIAVNPYITNGFGNSYPQISATYTWSDDNVAQAIDGYILYDETPNDRWTNYDNTGAHTSDSLTITLARPRNLTSVALAIFQDQGIIPTGQVACPQSITVTDGSGNTVADVADFLSSCLPGDLNMINFTRTVETQALTIAFTAQGGLAVGVSEVQLWVPGNAGPLYLAADAIAPGGVAGVAFDTGSTATSNGAVMSLGANNSNVQFSGIYYSASGSGSGSGSANLDVSYKNTGSGAVPMTVSVNQVSVASFSLDTAADYTTFTVGDIPLARGLNFVNFVGGASGLTLESITVPAGGS